jgi:hypothetical protein
MHVKPITAQEKFNFPRANAILARAQALLWVRDWQTLGNNVRNIGKHQMFLNLVGNIFASREANFVSATMFPRVGKPGFEITF